MLECDKRNLPHFTALPRISSKLLAGPTSATALSCGSLLDFPSSLDSWSHSSPGGDAASWSGDEWIFHSCPVLSCPVLLLFEPRTRPADPSTPHLLSTSYIDHLIIPSLANPTSTFHLHFIQPRYIHFISLTSTTRDTTPSYRNNNTLLLQHKNTHSRCLAALCSRPLTMSTASKLLSHGRPT
jgi:hypothetical protein